MWVSSCRGICKPLIYFKTKSSQTSSTFVRNQKNHRKLSVNQDCPRKNIKTKIMCCVQKKNVKNHTVRQCFGLRFTNRYVIYVLLVLAFSCRPSGSFSNPSPRYAPTSSLRTSRPRTAPVFLPRRRATRTWLRHRCRRKSVGRSRSP